MNNRKVFIGVLILAILVAISAPEPKTTQVVVPECFEDEECRVPIPGGYCGVDYHCVVGRCYSQPILCPEDCFKEGDEDMDGKSDCKDSDCWDTTACPCYRASFNECNLGRCYCQEGNPNWYTDGDFHVCECR